MARLRPVPIGVVKVRSVLWLLLGAVLCCSRPIDDPEPEGQFRPFLLRSRADSGYAPCSREVNLLIRPQCSALPRLGTAGFEALRRRLEGVGTARLHGEALAAAVISPDEKSLGRSILRLTEGEPTDDSGLLTDLSALLVARAQLLEDPRDLVRAEAAARRAVGLDPRSRAAIFNWALTLQAMGLDDEARRAWSRFREEETDPDWLGEAYAHARLLEQEWISWDQVAEGLSSRAEVGSTLDLMPRRYVPQLRAWVGDVLLPEWARAHLEGVEPESDRLLAIAQAVLNWLQKEAPDWTVEAALRLPLEDTLSEKQLSGLVEGHLQYARARELFSRQNNELALEPFADAERTLRRAGSPFWRWAAFYKAVCEYHSFAFEESRGSFQSLLAASSDGEPALRGRTRWMLSRAAQASGDLADAISLLEEALADFGQAHEMENIATVHSLLSLAYSSMGSNKKAWQHRFQSLSLVRWVSTDRRLSVIYEMALRGALDAGAIDLARLYAEELFRRVAPFDNPLLSSIASWRLARVARVAGNLDKADRWIRQAREATARIEGDGDRESMSALVSLEEGRIRARQDPAVGLETLGDTEEALAQQRQEMWVLEAKLATAEVLAGIGDVERATEEAEGALSLARSMADQVPRANLVEYSRELGDVFRWQVSQQFDRQPQESFRWGQERRRAQQDLLFTPTAGGEKNAVPALDSIPSHLPAGHVILVFEVVPERVLTWVISAGGWRATYFDLRESELERTVGRLHESVLSGNPELADRALEQLSRTFLPQLRDELSDSEVLTVVPDGPLHLVPFDALIEPWSGRRLLTRIDVTTLPVLQPESGRYRPKEPLRRVLAVGDPGYLDATAAPRPLPWSGQEAEAVAASYASSSLLLRERASTKELVGALAGQQVLHLAVHTVPNPGDPALSSFLLAPTEQGRTHELLPLSELVSSDLSSLELVVLASCESAFAELAESSGFGSFAAPLLGAGVSSVVATLWPVPDKGLTALFEEMHHLVADGVHPLQALGQAKRRLYSETGAKGLVRWAGVQHLGYPGQARKTDVASVINDVVIPERSQDVHTTSDLPGTCSHGVQHGNRRVLGIVPESWQR